MRLRYVSLETGSKGEEYYYCLTDGKVYEKQPYLAKKGTAFVTTVAIICAFVGAAAGRVVASLYGNNPTSAIWLYLGFLIFIACFIACVRDYRNRQKQVNLTPSRKSLSDFYPYLPVIVKSYRGQKLSLIICVFMLVIFALFFFVVPFVSMILCALFASQIYVFISHNGVFNKKKVIAQMKRQEAKL
jgi:hypothetical protein